MNSTFIFNSEITNQAKPFQVLNCTHLLLCLVEWCCQKGIQTNVLQMSNEELDKSLRWFYAEARTQTGWEYSHSSLLGFLNSIESHFIANNCRSLKLTGNPEFARSNKMLESKLKVLHWERAKKTFSTVIESQDLIKLKNSPFTSPNTPADLLWKVWVVCTLYWCRRGSEGECLHRRVTERCRWYRLCHNVPWRALKGSSGRLYWQIEWWETDRLVQQRSGRWCIFLLSQVPQQAQPKATTFFQKPREKF